MKQLSIDEIKNKQLHILDEIVKFCDNNNITYFLCGGTLLGAVRHKGYIPWDDDVDLMMPREDYTKLIDTFNHPDITLNSTRKLDDYYYPFIKVEDNHTEMDEHAFIGQTRKLGVNIDIFPLDNMPADSKPLKLFLNRMYFLRKALKLKRNKKSGVLVDDCLRSIGRKLMKPYTAKEVIDRINKSATRYNNCSTGYMGIVVWGYGRKELCRAEIFAEKVQVEFEGKKYFAPKGYKEYLTNVYGDYMTLPPKHKQVRPHTFLAYERNNTQK